MAKASGPQKTAFDAILEWSHGRPAWQQDALRRIVAQGRLETGDIGELVELCKQGRGKAGSALKPQPLAKPHLPATPGAGAAVSLLSLADAEGVNDLAPGQKLTFEKTGLTIVYGDNGAGKSGYARILKRACRARHAGKIEPNVYAQGSPTAPSARIAYSIGGTDQPAEMWQDAAGPHPVLSAVSVFDSECASVHLDEKNEVAFRPFGLDVPDELARVCQLVKDALTAEQKLLEKARNPLFTRPAWKDMTAVGKLMAALRYDTDLAKIKALATLTDEEAARMRRLKEGLAKDPAKAAAEQTLKADSIKRLLEAVTLVATQAGDTALVGVHAAAQNARVKRETAWIAAATAFSGEALPGVGGEVWRALWEAARRYSADVAYPGRPFPPPADDDDVFCVLCQQELPAEARGRMLGFEAFIQEDTERQAQEAEQSAATAVRTLAARSFSTRALKANLQQVAIDSVELARQARRFVAAARLRRYALVRSLESGQAPVLPETPPSPAEPLWALESKVRAYAQELRKSAAADERKKLEAELAELTDRALLSDMLPTVAEELDRLRGIHFLEACIGDTATNAITKFGNDLADVVITPKLRDRFQEEIVRLAAEKVRVEIVRSGGKAGSPQYQVRLFAKPNAKVRDILSEGERSCVALAAFLTEVATATHRSAFVFDDPISSLDHRWRGQVAKRLVAEAEHRQVIVFTHDLIFVNDLYDLGKDAGRPMALFTLARSGEGAGVVTEGLPWSAQSVEDRIDKMEKAARAAKKLYDKNEEEAYRKEAISIYGALRASWERGLEDIAVFRVVQRHRDYINQKDMKKLTALTVADCDAFHAGFKKCCDIIDSHDPSRGRNAEPPPPAEILQDIQTLKTWAGGLRERQKKIA
jgi:energy-coupling factor transporter ATP-binding protein EcfA2